MKRLLTLLFCASLFTSCKVGRFFFYNFADIKDYKKFPSRTIAASSTPFTFIEAPEKTPDSVKTTDGKKVDFDDYLDENATVAFLIIHKDSVKYERYFDGYDASSIVPSFSMAKSVTSMLIGCAIEDGLIASVDEPVTTYIPELTEEGFDQVSIEHVLQMTTGLDYNEGYYNPFGDVATFYYGTKLRKAVTKMKLETEPGTTFNYQSGNTQILGLILDRALKGETVSAYFERKIWSKIGTEYDASWSIDRKKNGLEKTFCCLNARAHDFAKLGRLYLHNGNWQGAQLVPQPWVEQSTKVDQTEGSAKYYQYQWWLPSETGDYMAVGILGQYIYVNPMKELIVVRLGKREANGDWWGLMRWIAKSY